MKITTVNLTPDGRVNLTAYIQQPSPEMPNRAVRPAMIVLPGGGYGFLSDREAEPIALSYLAAGFQAFVLRYTIGGEYRFEDALQDVSDAVKLVREQAEEWHLDPEKIAVCGFSAGGHLAAASGTLAEHKPNAMILAYPCILESISRILKFRVPSLDEAVTADTPPAFIFHTRNDQAVPVENSLRFADALDKAGVPFEMHIFGKGPHGISLANSVTNSGHPTLADPVVEQWMPMSVTWLNRLFGL